MTARRASAGVAAVLLAALLTGCGEPVVDATAGAAAPSPSTTPVSPTRAPASPSSPAVTSSSAAPPTAAATTAAATAPPELTLTDEQLAAGLSLTPGPDPVGTEMDVHGAVRGFFTDGEGNETGRTNPASEDSVQGIDESQFNAGDEHESTILVTPGTYAGKWVATEDGESTFLLRSLRGDAITSVTTYPIVDLPKGAVVRTTLTIPVGAGDLLIDEDANGSVDRTLRPFTPATGESAEDRVPPVSSATLAHFTAQDGTPMVRISLTAVDQPNAGDPAKPSGVAFIHHIVLVPNGAYGVYTGPLEVPAEGELVVRAMDAAGNTEYEFGELSLAPPKS